MIIIYQWEKRKYRFIKGVNLLFSQFSPMFTVFELCSVPDQLSGGIARIWISTLTCESSANTLLQRPQNVLQAPLTLPVCIHLSYFSFHLKNNKSPLILCVRVGVCDRLAWWFKVSRAEAFLGEMTRFVSSTPGSSPPPRWKGFTAPLFSLFACVKEF